MSNNIIDYSTNEKSTILKRSNCLVAKHLENIAKPKALVLSSELKDRASAYGWNGILTINNIFMLDGHGRLMIAECQADADTYINAEGRNTKNDYQLLMCLKASVTEEITSRM